MKHWDQDLHRVLDKFDDDDDDVFWYDLWNKEDVEFIKFRAGKEASKEPLFYQYKKIVRYLEKNF